jgi:hypothetical protein
MIALGRYKSFIALIILLLQLNPMLVKSLHLHSPDHPECGKNLPSGLNHAHTHKANCEICTFEYVTAITEEPYVEDVFRPELNENTTALPFSIPSLNIIFSPLRAPPAVL